VLERLARIIADCRRFDAHLFSRKPDSIKNDNSDTDRYNNSESCECFFHNALPAPENWMPKSADEQGILYFISGQLQLQFGIFLPPQYGAIG
jgi:hypothetical protein